MIELVMQRMREAVRKLKRRDILDDEDIGYIKEMIGMNHKPPTDEALTVEVVKKDGQTNLVFFPREKNELIVTLSNDAVFILAERLSNVATSHMNNVSAHWTFDLVPSNLPPDDLDNQEWRD